MLIGDGSCWEVWNFWIDCGNLITSGDVVGVNELAFDEKEIAVKRDVVGV